MGVGLILGFLRNNWKLILLGLIVAYVVFLRLEVSHYKQKAIDIKAEFEVAQDAAKVETARRQKEADSITAAHLNTLRNRGAQITASQEAAVKRIKAHEASKHVVVDPDVVKLFNDTTEVRQPTTAAKPADDGKASGTEAVNASAITLNDVLLVSAENNANHLKCVAQVDEWQRFWEEYAKSARRVN